MDSCFAALAVLLSLLAAACCAPAVHSLQDACADVRSSSLELNHIAQRVSIEAKNGSKAEPNFNTTLVWMEARDMCDPVTLKQKSTTCLGKLLDVLMRYKSAVERVARFQSCSAFVSKVKPAMHKLHKDMTNCVMSKTGMDDQKESHISKEDTQPIQHIGHWEKPLLCHYTMDRLFSFSILTARVFAVGDPAHHTEGSAHQCM